MKRVFIVLFLCYSGLIFAQVGINTDDPKATLDIQGNLRIGTRGDGQMDRKILTVNDDGIVNEIELVNPRKYTQSITVRPGESNAAIFTNTGGYKDSNIIIETINACARSMISSFSSSDGAVSFLGGIARDVNANFSIEPIPASESSYSPRLIITFPKVTKCKGDDGDETQFDFSFKKLSNTQYEIRNNGNVDRDITIIWSEL